MPEVPERPDAFAYRPQLDGLRAVAVAAVAWSHWERPYQFGVPFGAGVHLFYVLSGFLITGILLEVRAQADRSAALRAFYIRRALRIFPAFYLTLAVAWCADVPPVRDTLAWHAAYLSNVFIFLNGTWPGSISHWWSLAVEEQFYLVWPGLIVFAPQRCLVPAVVAAIVAAPAFRWWLASDGYSETMLAVLTPGCLDSLGIGALLALCTTWLESSALLRPGFSRAASAMAVVFGVVLAADQRVLPLWTLAIKQTLQAVVFGWLVFAAYRGMGGIVGRVLSLAPIVYVGRISYGVYLVHGFAGDILGGVGVSSRAIPEPWRFMILSALTVGCASLSWRFVEGPINALKARFPYTRSSGLRRGAAAAARCESRHP